jgi:hypothetical protein
MTRSGESDALDASHPGGRMGSQYDLAGPALLLATNAHLSGVTLPIDGGATLIPAARLPPGASDRTTSTCHSLTRSLPKARARDTCPSSGQID